MNKFFHIRQETTVQEWETFVKQVDQESKQTVCLHFHDDNPIVWNHVRKLPTYYQQLLGSGYRMVQRYTHAKVHLVIDSNVTQTGFGLWKESIEFWRRVHHIEFRTMRIMELRRFFQEMHPKCLLRSVKVIEIHMFPAYEEVFDSEDMARANPSKLVFDQLILHCSGPLVNHMYRLGHGNLGFGKHLILTKEEIASLDGNRLKQVGIYCEHLGTYIELMKKFSGIWINIDTSMEQWSLYTLQYLRYRRWRESGPKTIHLTEKDYAVKESPRHHRVSFSNGAILMTMEDNSTLTLEAKTSELGAFLKALKPKVHFISKYVSEIRVKFQSETELLGILRFIHFAFICDKIYSKQTTSIPRLSLHGDFHNRDESFYQQTLTSFCREFNSQAPVIQNFDDYIHLVWQLMDPFNSLKFYASNIGLVLAVPSKKTLEQLNIKLTSYVPYMKTLDTLLQLQKHVYVSTLMLRPESLRYMTESFTFTPESLESLRPSLFMRSRYDRMLQEEITRLLAMKDNIINLAECLLLVVLLSPRIATLIISLISQHHTIPVGQRFGPTGLTFMDWIEFIQSILDERVTFQRHRDILLQTLAKDPLCTCRFTQTLQSDLKYQLFNFL